MSKMPERPTAITDRRISRRTALGGLMTAVLVPTLVAAGDRTASATPTSTTIANPPVPPTNSSGDAASSIPRAMHTATALPDGRILIVGGLSTNNRPLSSVQIYDPFNNTWTNAAPMRTARFQHAAVALPDGRILVTGGMKHADTLLSSGEIYSLGADVWMPAPSLKISRSYHTLTALPDGRVIVMGGIHVTPLSGVEIYDVTAE